MAKNKLAVFGLAVLTLFVVAVIFAPSLTHLFGTDNLGRDIFSRAVYGARISLTVGLVAVTISMLIGVLMGATAGYFGGLIDGLIMRFVDVMLSFPSIFLILTVQAMLTPNIYNVMFVIGVTSG